MLKRIDYGGILTLFMSVGSCLVFLSEKYNELLPVRRVLRISCYILQQFTESLTDF